MKIGLLARMFPEHSLPKMRHIVEAACSKHKPWTLFGGVDLGSGQTTLLATQRGRTVEFIAFCNRLLAEYPNDTLDVIADNSSVHTSKEFKDYQATQPRLHMVYLPTYSFYLNNIELLWLYTRKAVCYNNYFAKVEWLVEEVITFITSLTNDRIKKAIGTPREVDNYSES